MMLSDVCLTTSVAYIFPAGDMCGRAAGWDGAYWLIGPGRAQDSRWALPVQGRGMLWRPPAQLVGSGSAALETSGSFYDSRVRYLYLWLCHRDREDPLYVYLVRYARRSDHSDSRTSRVGESTCSGQVRTQAGTAD